MRHFLNRQLEPKYEYHGLAKWKKKPFNSVVGKARMIATSKSVRTSGGLMASPR